MNINLKFYTNFEFNKRLSNCLFNHTWIEWLCTNIF